MKFAIYGLASLAGLGAVACAIGWFLPRSHVASASALVDMTPEQVYSLIADVEGYPSWWKDYDPIPVRTEEAIRPRRLVTRIEPGQPFGGTWTFDIVPEGAGSRLTITEHGEIYNLFFRFMSRTFMSQTATMEGMLRAMRQRQ